MGVYFMAYFVVDKTLSFASSCNNSMLIADCSFATLSYCSNYAFKAFAETFAASYFRTFTLRV
jgi:hypothetical protein